MARATHQREITLVTQPVQPTIIIIKQSRAGGNVVSSNEGEELDPILTTGATTDIDITRAALLVKSAPSLIAAMQSASRDLSPLDLPLKLKEHCDIIHSELFCDTSLR